MRLRCIGPYRSSAGSWEPGQDVDVSEEVAAFLLRDSPGSFEVPTAGGESVPPPAPSLAAISETNASGLTVPDRRARGGRVRKEQE